MKRSWSAAYRGRSLLVPLLCVLSPAAATAQVTISEATDEGLDCFVVTTSSATYYYDKAGAGFTSLVDRDGNDWLDFHPQGTPDVPNGQSGWYRGIPNMGLNVFGHPGYSGAVSTALSALDTSLPSVTIQSVKDGWSVTWEFFPSYAQLTIASTGENYWLLYEGVVGGLIDAGDTCWRASGESTALDAAWEGDIVNTSPYAPELEWVFFADGTLNRSLFLAHSDDQEIDRYYLMSPMTVFGFGRHSDNLDRLLSETNTVLLIGLVDSRDFAEVGAAIAAAAGQNTAATRRMIELDIKQLRDGGSSQAQLLARIKSYRLQR